MSLDYVFLLLENYKYWLLFPISILEGPIITIISGFLVSLGKLNFLTCFIILVLGDLLGDSIHYVIGYFGYKFKSITRISNEQFAQHPIKTLLIGKMTLGVGSLVLIAAGLSKYPFKKFIFYNFIVSFLKTFILLLVGYYFGKNYLLFDSYFAKAGIIFTVITAFVILQLVLRQNKQYNSSDKL